MNNLIKVIEEHKEELPVTQEQIEELKAIRDAHEEKLNAQITAEELSQAKTRDLGMHRKLGNKKVSYWNTDFKNDDSIPRELIVQMGFKVSKGKTSPPPDDPLEMSVSIKPNGDLDTKWKRNGNKPNTIFVIEIQTEEETVWKYLASINGTKYTMKGHKPGVQIAFRVTATRNNQTSSPSNNVAVAYYKG